MANDGKVTIIIDSNAKTATTDFNKLDKSLGNTSKGATKVSKSLVSLKGAIAGLALGYAVREVSRFTKSLVDASSEAQETAQKFNVTFSSISGYAKDAAASLASSFGLANDESQELLSATGDLLTGFGFTQKSALDLSIATNELAVDLASFTNLEGGAKRASEALTKALLGERESVKSLGIAILDSDVKAKVKAMEISGELTNQSDREKKAIATLQLAYEQSKNAIGDFNRSQSSFANQSRILESAMRNLSVEIGDELLPAFTELTSSLTKFLTENKEDIKQFSEGFVNFVTTTVRYAGVLVDAFAELSDNISYVFLAGEKDISKLLGLDDSKIADKITLINIELERLAGLEFPNLGTKQQATDLELLKKGLTRELELRTAIANVQKTSTGTTQKTIIPTPSKEDISSYDELTKKVKAAKEAVLELASLQIVDVNKFEDAKTKYQELAETLKQVNSSVKIDTDEKSKTSTENQATYWEGLSSNIESSMSNAFLASYQDGENLFTNLANSFEALFVQEVSKYMASTLMSQFNKTFDIGSAATSAAAASTQLATSGTVNASIMAASVAPAAALAVSYGALAASAGSAAISIANMAVSQAALSTAMIPFVGGFLAPVAAAATGIAIGAASITANSGLAAGSTIGSAGNFISGARENGGPVSSGSTYLVGEAGPELFTPKSSGAITSNKDMGSSSNVVNIYNSSGASVQTRKKDDRTTDIIIKEVNSALANERTNGAFSSAYSRQQSSGVQAV